MTKKICPGWQIFKPKCVPFPFRGNAHIATAHREPLLPSPSKDLARTVKGGNFVTFFAQINFFLKNALR